MLFCCYYALTRTDNFFPLPTDAEAGSLTNRWMRDTKQPMADGWQIGGSGPGKTPPATTTGQRTLEETLVWMREAGNQWKREVMLNAHQGLCCLASINIYPSPKTALDFFFFFVHIVEQQKQWDLSIHINCGSHTLQAEIPLVWNVDLVIGQRIVTVLPRQPKKLFLKKKKTPVWIWSSQTARLNSRRLRRLCAAVSEVCVESHPHPQTWGFSQCFPAIAGRHGEPQRLGGRGVFCLHRSPLVPTVLWRVDRWGGTGHRRPIQMEGVTEDRHQPGAASSSEGREGNGRGGKGRATPRNLTEPLQQWADMRKQLESSGLAWKRRDLEGSGVVKQAGGAVGRAQLANSWVFDMKWDITAEVLVHSDSGLDRQLSQERWWILFLL